MADQPIVFLSDFGLSDPYVGIVKGVIHALNPAVTVIDLTHKIEPQDIGHGAFILRYSYGDFPLGAIFLAVVDPGVGGQRAGLIVQCGRSLFIGPDNGILGPIIKKNSELSCFRIEQKWVRHEAERLGVRLASSNTFHARDIFGPSAALLSRGIAPKSLGHPYQHPEPFAFPEPEISTTWIKGQIIYIDHFGNAITNIPSALLDQLACPAAEKSLFLAITNHITIPFCTTYNEAQKEAPLFLENSYGLLEIAVNCGSAQQELGLKIGDNVEIRCIKE